MDTRHKVLIANRGEIAVRILHACRGLGLEFACVYTGEDSCSGHVALARSLGGEKSLYRISSYHDANELLSVADDSGCTAVHPGYGFFAEDYRFARRVVERTRSLVFLGPSWRLIRDLGDKINTKRLARSLSVPTVPGSDKPIYDEQEAEKVARSLFDFQLQQGVSRPMVLVKASAGGGGMGIEEVRDIDLFKHVYRRIRSYAQRQFKDDGVLIEQRIQDFNHLEVQILGDRSGKQIVHFGTRNCSIQSSGHQKRLEVAPGFALEGIDYGFDASAVQKEIIHHSVRMARKVGYDSVGTWEWIVTRSGHPFLMEVNTRIQVENGVSAAACLVNGRKPDLIAEQIRTGLGDPLGYGQDAITFHGVGIEYRIIAEDPDNSFMPWVGDIDSFSWKPFDWCQVHTHMPPVSPESPYSIPTEFDPNLALAIVWGASVSEAKTHGLEFLDHFVLEGHSKNGGPMRTNLSFLRKKTQEILEF
ncbi:MAG: acetyl-CoA carboxylase biotin carboxylase subunit [Mailhella sp.]|nr:acetyl-CoA carboxylase biotin carboxylase subunit [Mailhella sp.]